MEKNMLTNNAIVTVRNKPVSNVEQYLDAVKIRYADLTDIWNNYAADTQEIMGPNFVVTLKQNSNSEYQMQVHPVLKKKKITVYVPVVKGKKNISSYFNGQFFTDKKQFIKMEAA
jgi:hypothetical protein